MWRRYDDTRHFITPTLRWRLAMTAMAAAAAGLSLYLCWFWFAYRSMPGFGSLHVEWRRWAAGWGTFMGLPLAPLGVVVYGLMALGLAGTSPWIEPRWRARAWRVLLPLAVLSAGTSFWLGFVVQRIAIRRFCLPCEAIHLLGFILSICIILRAPLRIHRWRRSGSSDPIKIRLPEAAGLAGSAALAVLVLALGQLVINQGLKFDAFDPRLYENPPVRRSVTDNPGAGIPMPGTLRMTGRLEEPDPTGHRGVSGGAPPGPDGAGPATQPAGTMPAIPPRAPGPVTFLGGRLQIDAHDWPLVGAPEVPHQLAMMVDYAGASSRLLHRQLMEVRQRYPNQIALLVVLTPAPAPEGGDELAVANAAAARAFTRLALAVWRTNRPAFEGFHRWALEGQTRASVEAAQRQAEALLGGQWLARALKDPWIDQHLARVGEIHQMSSESVGPGRVLPYAPRLLFGQAMSAGAPGGTDDLCALLEARLSPRLIAAPASGATPPNAPGAFALPR